MRLTAAYIFTILMMSGMGTTIASEEPSQSWKGRLSETLSVEEYSRDQYEADAAKFRAHMPYMMVIPQEYAHVTAISQLFRRYGWDTTVPQKPVVDSASLDEAYERAIALEEDLIEKYEKLIHAAPDQHANNVLSNILQQTRHHLVMFNHARQMGGMMGRGMMGRGMMGGQ